ncbi:MAG TPA: hypothetical protein VFV19_07435 [Candidatus Polarisedimenticolaceae bacterium]|nr:hypothetical protein [Candidatus Polarisedimenticolaceae bacterium]
MSRERPKRLLRILEIVSTRRVATQEDLAQALTAEGWKVTQSSVSRDIQALKLVKGKNGYQRPAGAAAGRDPDEARIREGILTAEAAGDHLVVVHTSPGDAQRVAVSIDRLAWAEVLGTLAGDDTIFIAVADARATRPLIKRLAGPRRKA